MNPPEINPYSPPAAELQPLLEDKDLVYQEASKGKRFLNLILDQFAVVAVSAGFGIVLVLLEEMNLIHGVVEKLDNISTAQDMVFSTLLTVCYYMCMESLFGRSVGKLITGTKVLGTNGLKPSFGAILGRSWARMVPFEPFSFFGEHGWHDSWSGTQVVDVRKPKVPALRPSVMRYYR